jgi:hypothetical protein
MENSEFRTWLKNMYLENCKEREEWNSIPYESLSEYFNFYKYWLKREFKNQRQIKNEA